MKLRFPGKRKPAAPHRIELSIWGVSQLFNTMDPSPFQEKDLDPDAEEFIVSWASEFPVDEPIVLVLHLGEFPPEGNPQPKVEEAVHNFFAHSRELNTLQFRRLMADGRRTLLTGLLFLAACLIAAESLGRLSGGTMMDIVRESLTIAGWVAMWRPMEIYLYEWWPVLRLGKTFAKLSKMPVEVQLGGNKPGA